MSNYYRHLNVFVHQNHLFRANWVCDEWLFSWVYTSRCSVQSILIIARLILGQPLGGLLYTRFGFRGPFIFSLTCTFVDLVSRFVVIEPSDAKKWGVDPTILSKPKPSNGNINLEAERGTINLASEPQSGIEIQEDATLPSQGARVSSQGNFVSESKGTVDEVEVSLSLLQVLLRLSKSPRALVALGVVFVYGYLMLCYILYIP